MPITIDRPDSETTVVVIDGRDVLLRPAGPRETEVFLLPETDPAEQDQPQALKVVATGVASNAGGALADRVRGGVHDLASGGGVTHLHQVARSEQSGDAASDRFASRRAEVELAAHLAHRRRRRNLVVGSLAVSAAILFITAGPILRVRHVEFVGANNLDTQMLSHAAKLDAQPSMLSLSVETIESRLRSVPLIQNVVVWKEWPNTIVVQIAERSAVASMRSGNGWVIVDQQGGVLEQRSVRPDLPQLDFAGRTPDLHSANLPALLLVANAASPKLRQQIDTISLDASKTLSGKSGTVTIRLRQGVVAANDSLAIKLGHADDVEAKLRALATMLDSTTSVSFRDASALDLSVADQPALILPAPQPQDSMTALPTPIGSVHGAQTADSASTAPERSNVEQ